MSAASEVNERCSALRSLHVPGRPLILPNAWDAGSARAVVAAGFAAVATTSAGIAATLGFEDHEDAPSTEMLAAAARIAEAVDVPLTVDAESGYGLPAEELVEAFLGARAAGCNLEDTDHRTGALRAPDVQAERLATFRAAADRLDYPMVLNARPDVFVRAPDMDQGSLVEEALARATAYLDAGADCVYPIALHDRAAIESFVEGASGAVNVLASPAAPPIPELAAIGVARVSYGSSIYAGLMDELIGFLEGRRERLGGAVAPPRPRAEREDA